MYKYRHSPDEKTVYKFTSQPTIHEERNAKGKRTGWFAYIDVDITRADNRLKLNRWLYPTSDRPTQHFDYRYDKEQVAMYFLSHHSPQGSEISEEEYVRLRDKYESKIGT